MLAYSSKIKDFFLLVGAIFSLCVLGGIVVVSVSPKLALIFAAFILISLLMPPLLGKLHIFLYTFIALIPLGTMIPLLKDKLTIIPLLGLSLFGLWFINLCTKKGSLRIVPEFKWFFALMVVMLTSSWMGTDMGRSLHLAKTYIQLFFLFFLIIQIFKQPKHLFFIGWILIISFSVVALFMLLDQMQSASTIDQQHLANTTAIDLLAKYEIEVMHAQAKGVRGDPNYSCLDFSVAICFVLYYLAVYKTFLIRSFLVSCLAILVCAIIFTHSSGGAVGLLSAAFFFVLFHRNVGIEKKVCMFIFLVPIICAVYILSPPSFKIRIHEKFISTTQNEEFSEWGTGRGGIWLGALLAIKENPVFGAGVGNGSVEIAKTAFRGQLQNVVAHNVLLAMAADNGIVGVFIFLMLIGSILKKLYAKLKISSPIVDRDFLYVGSAIFLSLIVYLIQSMFLSTEYDKLLWILLGLATSFIAIVNQGPDRTNEN